MTTEKLKADWLMDNSSMDDAIGDTGINPEIFKDRIQAYLDEQYALHDNPFENENEATEYWLEEEGYELIRERIHYFG